MDAAVRKLLRSLRTAESVEPAWKAIDRWVAARDLCRVREAGVALTDASVDAPGWTVRSVWGYLVNKLALTPDADFAVALRDLARRRDAPYLASLVASGQTFHVAERLVTEGRIGDDEFLACLTQELVLRNAQSEREPFKSLQRRLREQRHPLGWLPLHLTQIEGGVQLPHHHDRGMTLSVPFGPTHDDDDQPDTAYVARIGKEITSAAEAGLCATAFQDWLENSNGNVEARFFELVPDLEVVPLADALRATTLDCLADASDLRVVDASATDAFGLAFAAASTGGAYSHGHRGAYGRLAAWATLAGLAGLQADVPFEAVCAAVESTRWFRFETDAPWFYCVAWDVGLVAERSDGRSLAVLAATDTD